VPSTITIRSATLARFDDVAIMVGPKNPDSSVPVPESPHRRENQPRSSAGHVVIM
jgi:hypothetical protein